MTMVSLGFLLNSTALGAGLAMDAFSVSLANGLREPQMRGQRMCLIAGVYAVFQYAMPMIGWICIHTIASFFSGFQKLIPWIALILLLYIGGKMLLEGLRERKETEHNGSGSAQSARTPPVSSSLRQLPVRDLLLQGTATSIDALSVGFTIAGYSAAMANLASVIIGGVTFVICIAGLLIGRKAGTRLSWKASILGGIILIAIGIRIFAAG